MPGSFLMAVPDATQTRTVIEKALRSGVMLQCVAWNQLVQLVAGSVIDGVIGEIATDQATAQLEVLRVVRARSPRLPMLAVVEAPTSRLLDDLHLLNVSVCGLPLATDNLQHFVANACIAPSVGDDVLHERVRRAATHKGLTRRESELLRLATAGLPRRLIAERLAVSENTVKAQIRSLLRKTGARNLAVLGQQLLRGDSTATAS